jgi:beta-fructofuranosidase
VFTNWQSRYSTRECTFWNKSMMKLDRRDFLAGLIGTAAVSTLIQAFRANPVFASAAPFSLAGDPRRPQFHLLPAANWMNDPNGPIYFRGKYHMFYQYNPNGALWGDMHWDHAVSTDMVHWKHLGVALAPAPGGPDADGCFSGSIVVQNGQAVMLYTAVRAVPETQATIKEGSHSLLETQCLATANDSELRTWTKLPAPVIAVPPAGLAVTGFRDPSPWRQGGWWYMVIGSGLEGKGGAVLLYKSRDLRRWEFMHILAQREGSIALATEQQAKREVWECPELFALGDKHVLIYSTSGKTYWMAGTLVPKTMAFHPETTGVLDYGSFYAPKTQLDKAGNRILWGWIPETRPEAEHKAAGWACMMSLPRVLSMAGDGRLRIDAAPEVTQLRKPEQALQVTADDKKNLHQIGELRIEQYSGEILCTARRDAQPYELSLLGAGDDAEKWLTVKYDPLHPGQVSIDGTLLPVGLDEKADLELHLYIDGSVMELFVNKQSAFTKRVYCPGNRAHDLRMQWTGKTSSLLKLLIWNMAPISADRLTS